LIITRLQVQRSLRRSSTPNEGEYSAFYTSVLQDTG
jgi:hypothetical protein